MSHSYYSAITTAITLESINITKISIILQDSKIEITVDGPYVESKQDYSLNSLILKAEGAVVDMQEGS